MKIIRFHSLALAGLLFTASCTQQPKKEKFNNDTLVKAEVAQPKTRKLDTVKPVSTKTCSQIAYLILTTSPRYQSLTNGLKERIIKNGGTSFYISYEGSPYSKIDSATNYSETYDYSIHENYPDHAPLIASFTFDPAKKQLFEYNVAQDSLMPAAFDKTLLVDLARACE
ncbi:hypothetical protein AY601_2502 [Pedobacter cryoconitis]|uniref:Lipoprotein n=1 Tax=Pedobacter cryoconitis TaxID=188932 RepID=A0A127VDU6_9SPHI|nr:hypothetical protein [Pedobacter cryoconitis]AMP99391.1 hypothetical protein AY601_2502 [Pedobacter cryoconitis]